MRTSGEERVIVGTECNEFVNNYTAGMREIPEKYTESETSLAQRSTLSNKLQMCCKQCAHLNTTDETGLVQSVHSTIGFHRYTQSLPRRH